MIYMPENPIIYSRKIFRAFYIPSLFYKIYVRGYTISQIVNKLEIIVLYQKLGYVIGYPPELIKKKE